MKDKDERNLFTRRCFILGAIQGGLAVGLIGRLYVLQVLNRQHYQLLSDKNRIQSLDLLPTRGKLFDRKGVLLAGNQTTYRSLINLDEVKEVQLILAKLKPLIEMDDQILDRIHSQLKKRRKAFAILLKENLSWEELSRLELHAPDLPWLIIEKNQTRFYPYPEQTAHVIGYVAAINEKDLAKNPKLDLPGLKIGKSGLENTQDEILRGYPGLKQVEVNASQRIVRTLDTIESESGQDLHLTLDFPLQKAVTHSLQSTQSAAAVVLDVKTGAVLALVSHPSFNANLFTNGIGKNDWQTLISHPDRPLNNKIVTGLYSPGSTFKMIVGLAGLHRGAVNAHTPFYCPGHYDFHGQRFHCWNWKQGGHGTMTLESAITQSCDVYFYQLANILGVDAIAQVAKDFGLGLPTGIELPFEKAGLIPTRSWKQFHKGQSWSRGDTLNVSIGQGYVLTTPLQLAKMTAMLANGFCPIDPHLLKKTTPVQPSLPYTEADRRWIIQGMIGVVNNPQGTAYHARIIQGGQEMAGKTGSTQVIRITERQRQQNTHNEQSYHLREHALFVGYAPLDRPRFAVCVVVEHGGSGARAAAPLGRDILTAAQQLVT